MASMDEQAVVGGETTTSLPLHEFETVSSRTFSSMGLMSSREPDDVTKGGKVNRDDVKQPVTKASWVQMATVMVGDVVGVGVLTLASALAKVGWIPGMIMLFGFFPLNAYTGILLSRTRKLVPKSVTMGDMAYYTVGKWAMYIVAGYIYCNVFFILGDYLLVTGQSLGMVFFNTHLCKPVWMAIAAAVIWAIMQFSRTLHYVSYLCWFNMVCITVSVFIAVIYLFIQGKEVSLDGAYTEAVNPDLTIQSFFGALSSFLFAYSGQFMYLELMAEMKQPEDFPKTFLIAGPYQLFMFSFVSGVGYAYKGNEVSGFIINNIPYGAAYATSAAFLFLHMLVTWQIKGQVLSRAIHVGLHPASANDTGITGNLVWAGITFCVLALNWIMSTAIPFFDYFTALLGSLQALPTLVFPVIFFIAARRAAGQSIHILEYVFMASFCIVLGLMQVVFGMWDAVSGIISSYSTLGGPFSCQCHDIWATGCTTTS